MTKIDLDQIGPLNVRSAFTNKNTHPLVLDLLLLEAFSKEYLTWEPETIWMEIHKTFGSECSEVCRAKIQAARTCHVSDLPFTAWDVFEKVGISFSGSVPLFSEMQRLTPHSCALAISVMSKIRSIRPSDEVMKYCAASCMDEGMVFAPPPISAVNTHLLSLGVPDDAQSRVRALVGGAYTPQFDGTNDYDIQVFKSQSVVDYVNYHSRQFQSQAKRLFKEKM